jgi:hypothetical protein
MLMFPRPFGVLQKLYDKIAKNKKIEYEVSYNDLRIILDMVFELLYREGWLKERPVLTKTIIEALERERMGRSDAQGIIDQCQEVYGPSYPDEHWPPSCGNGFRGPYGGNFSFSDPPEEPEGKKDVISTGDLIQNHVRKLKGSGGATPPKAKRPPQPAQHTEETLDGHAEYEADQKASLKRKKRGDGEW